MTGQPALTLLHPDEAPEKKEGYLNASGNSVGSVNVPFPALDNSKVFAPNELVTGTGVASTDPSVSNWFIPIHEERQGVLLPSIPGYPAQLPSLQITPSGRLAFWNYPAYLERFPGASSIWSVGFTSNNTALKPISSLLSMTDWNTYLNTFQYESLTFSQWKTIRCAYNNGTYTDGSAINPATCIATPKVPVASMLCTAIEKGDGTIQLPGDDYFEEIRPDQWIFLNVQYWVGQFLKSPYSVEAPVPYGSNWYGINGLFMQAFQKGQFTQFIQNVDFLIMPVGKKTFLDDVYSVVPIIIAGAASIITAGAATPALIAAVGSAYISSQVNNESKQGNTIIAQEAAQNSANNLNASNISTTVTTQVEQQYGPIIVMPPAQNITLPNDSVMLDASKTTSVSGTDPIAYEWALLSGPSENISFDNSASATPTVSGLVQGTYVFQLTATDTLSSVKATGTVSVTVNPGLPNPVQMLQEWYANVQANQKTGFVFLAFLAAAVIVAAVVIYTKEEKK